MARPFGSLILAVLLGVPFFPDKTDQCGPSALASVLAFWGKPAEPKDLKTEIYVEKIGGSLPMDLLIAARAHGLAAEMSSGSLDGIKANLDAGRPVIAFVNMGWRFLPIGHFLVVTGYDEARRGVYAHTGVRKDAFVPYRQFLKQWDRTGRWALVVAAGPS
ncbi:MAG: C39 family peptidase [Elusimicrobia bacterium]|nr:C39 family peptidase [Elusimicrobiota bacterium]